MMRMRRFATLGALSMDSIRRCVGQFQNERGAASRPLALSTQGSTQLLGCQCAAVQAEPVPGLARREAVIEEATHVLCGDTHTVVNDGDAHAVRVTRDA